MSDCLFCKIIAKEIPSTAVYEDDDVYAFLDISPVHPGHTLVVPKTHASTLLEISPQALIKTVLVVQRISAAVKRGLGVEGFNISQNNGAVAGQTVHHMHMHIIPRQAGDGFAAWPQRRYASLEEAQAWAEKIRAFLV